jgi:hypothetical protein
VVRLAGHSEGGWFSFHDIHASVFGSGCGWVEHNVWCHGFSCGSFGGCAGSARCWVLRGHPVLLGGVFSGCSWSGSSNAPLCRGGGGWCGLGCGCVLSVA